MTRSPCRSAATTLGLLGLSALVLAQSPAPTLAVVNAKVFTGVSAAPWAEAFTIVGEHIGLVGTSAAVRALAGPQTRAAGRVVVPGVLTLVGGRVVHEQE